MLCEHISTHVGLITKVLLWLVLTPFHFICPQPNFLQHYIFVSIYHILWSHIFQDVNVVIPSAIWVSICYITCVRVSALHPMIHFQIVLQLSCQKMEFIYRERFPTFSLPYTKMSEYYHHQRGFWTLANIIITDSNSYKFDTTCFVMTTHVAIVATLKKTHFYTKWVSRDDFIPLL